MTKTFEEDFSLVAMEILDIMSHTSYENRHVVSLDDIEDKLHYRGIYIKDLKDFLVTFMQELEKVDYVLSIHGISAMDGSHVVCYCLSEHGRWMVNKNTREQPYFVGN